MDKWQELATWLMHERQEGEHPAPITVSVITEVLRKMAELEAREQDIKNKYANMLKPLPTKSEALGYAKLAQRLDELERLLNDRITLLEKVVTGAQRQALEHICADINELKRRFEEHEHNIVFSFGKTTSAPIKGEE